MEKAKTGLTYREIMTMKREAVVRAGHRCEGSEEYPQCRAREGIAHPDTDKTTVLSVIQTMPGEWKVEGLRVMCQRCFLTFDFRNHATQDWRARRSAMRNGELFDIPERKY